MKATLTILSFLITATVCHAQVSGNVGYAQGGGRVRAENAERAKRSVAANELPPSGTAMFLDAAVLMNVKADEYIAVFALSQEGPSVAECNRKMDALVRDFGASLKKLGIADDDVTLDFITQSKTYGYEFEGKVAREKLVGFDLKKNVSVRYKDKAMLDKLMVAASASQIYDLVKVDYIVKDQESVHNKLYDEATRVIKLKAARHEKLLGIKLAQPPQVHVERTSSYVPTEMYDSYVAQESEHVESPFERGKFLIQGARKGRTFYYNPLTANGFDAVVNPVITEPVVQFTLYVRLKYEIEGAKVKASKQ
ncbi:MAG: SIMPL domain-containing protein [Planctomycetes bacterium]|nr:SIMPL domain-containing protein [Planctomycetota bacterium]